MHASSCEAAVMYARACRAWYGKRALSVVTKQIRDLRRRGDSDGVAIWTKVAANLSELAEAHKHHHNELRGKLY